MTKRLLSTHDVEQKTTFKKSSIYAKIKAGLFPAPVKIGSRNVWLESEIDAWMIQQVSGKRAVKTAS